MDWEGTEANYIAGTPYVGVDAKYYAGPGGNMGFFTAWDPVRNGPAWQIPEKYPVWSGASATAGDVVFYGTMEGWFKAVDAKTGTLLWQFKTGSGIIGQPVTYRGPDGKQYIAILSGIGGWPGAIVAGDLDNTGPDGCGRVGQSDGGPAKGHYKGRYVICFRASLTSSDRHSVWRYCSGWCLYLAARMPIKP